MLKDSANKIYKNSGNQYVLKLLPVSGKMILDVGCGSGALGRILTGQGNKVHGITISTGEFEEAKMHLADTFLHNLEHGLPLEVLRSKYDYVICSHVLEHLVYPDKLLTDIYSVLKPGGNLVVALPNIMHYKSRLKLAAGNFEYKDSGTWDNTHVKWYTYETAKRLLISHGFRIEQSTVTGELPFNSFFIKVLPVWLRQHLFRLLSKISKGLFGYQLLFKAGKG